MFKSKAKKFIRVLLDCLLLFYGLVFYLLNNQKPLHHRTPQKAYLAMIRLFCLTSGRSNDILSKCISFFDKRIRFSNYHGILGNLSFEEVSHITTSLRSNGYYIFEQKVPEALIKTLYQFALEQEFVPRKMDDQDQATTPTKTRYDKNDLKSAIYDLSAEVILSHPDIQALLSDRSILSVAQEYLEASPKLDITALWWSTPYSNKPQSSAAQLFHFDMDRIKWLKFFIFLTDVTLENGPHVFVSKSHQSGKIPATLLKAGYERHTDSEVFKHFDAKDIKTFTVPAGTILAEDTRGLHKGTNLIQGERLVLELQFSNSLFGANTPATEKITLQNETLKNFLKSNPKIFKLYPI